MNYKGKFLSVNALPGRVFAIEYISDLRSVAAVNVSDEEEHKTANLMILDPASGT